MSFLKRFHLLPREDKFFTLLEQLSAQAALCVQHLKDFSDNTDPAHRAQLAADINQRRVTSKNIFTKVTRELWRSYITPFDREDIQEFAAALYKIPKIIDKVKDRLVLPGLESHKDDYAQQISVIVEEAHAVESMVAALVHKNNEDLKNKIALVYDLEVKGDLILGQLLTALFENTRDPRDLILRKDIYDFLEKIIDRYRDIAAVALRITLKYS